MTDVQNTPAMQADDQTEQNLKQKRKKMFSLLFVFLIIAAMIYALWYFIFSGTQSTDNAYVDADTAQVTSMVSGQVAKVLVQDTQQVHAGDILLEIDNRDAKIALGQAEATLAKAKRQYKQTAATSNSLESKFVVSTDAIASAQAQVAKAQVDYDRAKQDLDRRNTLAASGAISKEELSSAHATTRTALAALNVAKAGLAEAESNREAAQSTLDANNALISGASENSTPDVLLAQAQVQQAQLDLERTIIRAPVDGVVTNRNVQIGQRVAPGTVVMNVVPVQQLYVNANFKESQLAKVKVGQKATLTSDLYGSDVVFHGTVVGFSGGTGAAFALIPAQNATGNWIKVVQRLPVRISLDAKELAAHPLRVGLSMDAEVELTSKK